MIAQGNGGRASALETGATLPQQWEEGLTHQSNQNRTLKLSITKVSRLQTQTYTQTPNTHDCIYGGLTSTLVIQSNGGRAPDLEKRSHPSTTVGGIGYPAEQSDCMLRW